MGESVKQTVQYSPLVLACFGDAVCGPYIREHILDRGNQPVNRVHGQTVHYVKAGAQAKLARYLEPGFTGEEGSILRRRRNAYANTMTKNTSMIDYCLTAAFEALVGYRQLSRKGECFRNLVGAGSEALEQEERQAYRRKRN